MKLISQLLFLSLAIAFGEQESSISLGKLLTEQRDNPTLEVLEPRFSWQIETDSNAVQQKAYQIILAETSEQLKKGQKPIWNSQKTTSAQSHLVDYKGPELKRGQTYYWKVRIWTHPDQITPWSETSSFSIRSFLADPTILAEFSCSDPALTKAYQDARKTRLNYLATGAPAADDLQLISRATAFDINANAFFKDWLERFKAKQLGNGFFPKGLDPRRDAIALSGASEAAIIVPYILWQTTGDARFNQAHLAKQVQHLAALQKIDEKFEGNFPPQFSLTQEPSLRPMAYFALGCRFVSELASKEEHFPHAIQHSKWFEFLQKSFNQVQLTEEKALKAGDQSSRLLALRVGLPNAESAQVISKNLLADLQANGLTADKHGIMAVLPYLSRQEPALAFKIARQLATDSEEPLIKLSAISEWLMTFVAGINHEAPGFQNIRIAPLITDELEWAKAHYDCPYGRINTHWKNESDKLVLEVSTPPNTIAIISLPAAKDSQVLANGEALENKKRAQFIRENNGRKEILIQSGQHRFEVLK